MVIVTWDEKEHSDQWSWDKTQERSPKNKGFCLYFLQVIQWIENWNICAKEFKNPLFHKIWAPQQHHCQVCLKSFLAVQVPNQFQICQRDMAKCHGQWCSGTRQTREEQVCCCILRKSTIPLSAVTTLTLLICYVTQDISWQTTSCTLCLDQI